MFTEKLITEDIDITVFNETFAKVQASEDAEVSIKQMSARVHRPIKSVQVKSKTLNTNIIFVPLYVQVMNGKRTTDYQLVRLCAMVRQYSDNTDFTFKTLSKLDTKTLTNTEHVNNN